LDPLGLQQKSAVMRGADPVNFQCLSQMMEAKEDLAKQIIIEATPSSIATIASIAASWPGLSHHSYGIAEGH